MTAPGGQSNGSRPKASSEFGGPTLHGAAARVAEPQPTASPAASPTGSPAGSPEADHSGHWSSTGAADGAVAVEAAAPVTTRVPAGDATTSMTAVSAPTASMPTASVPPVTPPAAAPSGAGGPGGPGAAGRAPRPKKSSRGPRRARLQLRGISVWSALRFSVVLSIAMFCVWMVMVGVLYGILDGVGAITKVNDAIVRIDPTTTSTTVTPSMVFGGGVVIGAVYMVLFIAISTVGTLIYNLCADLVGGVELTLSERE